MNQGRLLKDLSANTIQTGVTQLTALLIFYIVSRYIPKADFGAYNWATAVSSTILAIASFGLDLVLVKRIAAGRNPPQLAGIHFFHTLLSGALLLGIALLLRRLFPEVLDGRPLFLFVFVQLLIANIANSFKFSLTGLEAFRFLAVIAVCANLLKLLAVGILLPLHCFSIRWVITGFICSSAAEALLAAYYLRRRLGSTVVPVFSPTEYGSLIREALPQLGVVLFDSALARVDWILLGLLSTASMTAEYSFAYKFFELSKLPLLILAPVLLTRMTRLFHRETAIDEAARWQISQLFRLEMFISLLIPVFMVCAWTPLIDYVTDNKYGAVNQNTFSILAFCIPLHYLINFLWTMGFVQGQLKQIMYITIGVSLFNLLANVLLIPALGSTGSALAFLAGTLIQLGAYLLLIRQERLRLPLRSFLLALANGCAAVLAAKASNLPALPAAGLALLLYFGAALLTRQLPLSLLRSFTRKIS